MIPLMQLRVRDGPGSRFTPNRARAQVVAMRTQRWWRARNAFFVLAGVLTLPLAAGAANPTAEKPAVVPSKIEATLFTVEFNRTCGHPIYPGMLGGIVTSSAPKASWRLKTTGPPPLVSHEAVQYSAVGTSGETSLPTARILAEIGPGGELSYKSDRGRNVVLQVDVKTVCWDIDQAKAMATAKKGRSSRALFAVLRSEDLTADVNPKGEFGSQKSFAVSLELTLVDTDSGEVVGSFSDETRVMDLSASGAVRRAAKSLVTKGLKTLSSGT